MKKLKLDEREKKKYFEAPEGYFEDLPMRIQKRIEKQKAGVARESWLPKPALRWAFAVAAAALVFVFGIVNRNSDTGDHVNALESIATADLIYFLENEAQLDGLDTDELIRVFDELGKKDSLWSEYEYQILPEENLNEDEWLQLYERFSAPDEVL